MFIIFRFQTKKLNSNLYGRAKELGCVQNIPREQIANFEFPPITVIDSFTFESEAKGEKEENNMFSFPNLQVMRKRFEFRKERKEIGNKTYTFNIQGIQTQDSKTIPDISTSAQAIVFIDFVNGNHWIVVRADRVKDSVSIYFYFFKKKIIKINIIKVSKKWKIQN